MFSQLMEELCLIYNTSKLKALFENTHYDKTQRYDHNLFTFTKSSGNEEKILGGHILVDSAGFQKQVLLQLLS